MAVRQHKYADNCEYFGEWNSEGQRHGYGHLKYSDGVDYKGELNKGWQQGYGIMTIPANASPHQYEGQFDQGCFSGFGVFIQSDGMKYEGEFTQGNITGRGLITFKDGTSGIPRYEGQFEAGSLAKPCDCSEQVTKARDASGRAKQAAFKAKEVAERARNGSSEAKGQKL